MSRTPAQQCGHPTSDRPYLDLPSRSHQPGQMPMTYHQPYGRHEPRLCPSSEVGYERPLLPPTPGPRLPALGHSIERSADPRYMLSSDNSYTNRHALPHTLPLRMHHHGAATVDPRGYHDPYEERSSPMLSHSREHASHRVRTYDLDIQ